MCTSLAFSTRSPRCGWVTQQFACGAGMTTAVKEELNQASTTAIQLQPLLWSSAVLKSHKEPNIRNSTSCRYLTTSMRTGRIADPLACTPRNFFLNGDIVAFGEAWCVEYVNLFACLLFVKCTLCGDDAVKYLLLEIIVVLALALFCSQFFRNYRSLGPRVLPTLPDTQQPPNFVQFWEPKSSPRDFDADEVVAVSDGNEKGGNSCRKGLSRSCLIFAEASWFHLQLLFC